MRNTLNYFDFVMLGTQDITKNALQRSLRSLKRYNVPLQVMVITPSVTTGVTEDEYIEPATGINNRGNSLAPSRELSFEVQNSCHSWWQAKVVKNEKRKKTFMTNHYYYVYDKKRVIGYMCNGNGGV